MNLRASTKDRILRTISDSDESRMWTSVGLAKKFGLTEEFVQLCLNEMMKERPYLFDVIGPEGSNPFFMLQSEYVEHVLSFLERGGYKKIDDEIDEKGRLQLEKDRLEAEALRLQIEDFPKMKRERFITRCIAIGAAIISIIAIIVQIVFN